MTTFTRTIVRFPIARVLMLAGIVTVAGCGSYDDSQQATGTETTPVADANTSAEPTQIAAAPKLPAAALIASNENDARKAIRDANLPDTTAAARTPTTMPAEPAASTLSVVPTRL
ncbi:MAG: hypothetical protein V3S08_00235, partial [Phycisphaerales bacterium]